MSTDPTSDQPTADLPESGGGGDTGDLTGRIVGRYRARHLIGAGGFGAVYEAEQTEPVRRAVALKVIKPGMDSDAVLARFEAERQALAVMDHPCVAKVFDGGSTERGLPYFAMELVRGLPITEHCDRHRLSLEQRIELFVRVCEAVQHAHTKGVIHRDLKPANILVEYEDGKSTPKVIDFGVAKALNQRLSDTTICTARGELIGTPAYMSPEQAEMSGQDIDTRSDVYALGVILYELLTGSRPFEAETLRLAGWAEIQRIIREVEPPRPSTKLGAIAANDDGLSAATTIAEKRRTELRALTSTLRRDLDWVVMKCLEKDRERRYETASALATELRRFLDDEPVSAGPPSASYKLKKFVKRNRGRVVAVGLLAVVLLLGVIATSSGMAWALREKSRADSALARATEIKRLITEMLQSVSPEQAKGADTTLLHDILDNAAGRLASGEIRDELVAAELHMIVGGVYRDIGSYTEAEQHLRKAAQMRVRLLGPDDPATHEAMIAEANLDFLQGRLDAAEKLCRDVLESKRRVVGPDHPSVIASMGNLASLCMAQGRYGEAETLYQSTIELQTRVLGPEHAETLATVHNLATLYHYQGRLDEAEQLCLATIASLEQVHGPTHPQTLQWKGNLAALHITQGRHADAERLLLETLEAQERVQGADHPVTLATVSNLGLLYNSMERYEDAAPMFERSLPEKRRRLGAAHPRARMDMRGLAEAYLHLGRRDEAVALYGELLALDTAAADAKDATASVLNDAAWALLTHEIGGLRDPGRALGYAQRACEAERASGGSRLWTYLDTLALAQHSAGDDAAAVETQRQAISLLPTPDADPEMRDRLAEYEAALDAPNRPDLSGGG